MNTINIHRLSGRMSGFLCAAAVALALAGCSPQSAEPAPVDTAAGDATAEVSQAAIESPTQAEPLEVKVVVDHEAHNHQISMKLFEKAKKK